MRFDAASPETRCVKIIGFGPKTIITRWHLLLRGHELDALSLSPNSNDHVLARSQIVAIFVASIVLYAA